MEGDAFLSRAKRSNEFLVAHIACALFTIRQPSREVTMLHFVILILVSIAIRTAGGKPGFFVRRLVRHFTILAIILLMAVLFESGLSFSDLFDSTGMPMTLAMLTFLLIPWVFIDLVPSLVDRKGPSD